MKHFLALLLGSLASHVLASVVLGVRGHQSAWRSQSFQSPAELKAAVDGWAIGGERRSQLLSRYGPMARWDVSQVTNMSGLFQSKAFNEDIASWNTSAVNDMSFMFADARSFNKPLRSWNTSAVEDMNHMFYNAATFDQALDLWNTSRVKTMSFMFGNADEFNQSIGSWDTSSVQDMSCMFCYTKAFDQPIGSWNTSAVTDMNSMFKGAASFNQPIGSWDTASVTDMSSMFQHAVAFNQPIGSWNTASVRLMISMFEDAYAFDQFLGFWNIWSVVDRLHMFLNATSFDQPPCRAGRAPAANNLGCTPCPAGQFAVAGARDCESCPAGWISSRNRTVCEQCPEFEYSTGKSDACKRCNFPLILMQNRCVWWHLPLMAFGIVGLAVAGKVVASFSHARTAKKVETIMSELYQDLWIDSESIHKYSAQLEALGLQDADVAERVTAMRALQSERAGVSMRYLLSESFHHLATSRTGKEDPSFMDMKTAFWLSSDPIGHDVRCPRDGRMGCALVDWIPSAERREQTHFMSWTWQYSLMQVRSALDMFQVMTADGPQGPQGPQGPGALDGGDVFFFMCFFVNNQFRIIVEESTTGSANLEDVFENHLKRIGRMVAILDTWEQPVYLQRIWTVYEQFVASTLEIQVTFVMPSAAAGRLEQQIFRGAKGIVEVSQAVGCVNSQLATAWKWEDEVKVKALIQERVGFQHVDQHVKRVMVRWIGDVMKAKFQELVDHTCRVRECGGKASVRQIVQV